jgi:hypothetical protein
MDGFIGLTWDPSQVAKGQAEPMKEFFAAEWIANGRALNGVLSAIVRPE